MAEGKIGYVYIISNEYDQIKIGVSVNPVRRIKNIENQSGINIKKQYYSAPCTNFKKN